MINQVTIQMTARQIAKIAAKSPGYSVTVIDGGKTYTYTDIAVLIRNGRKVNSVITAKGERGNFAVFDADTVFNILD